MMPGPSTSRRDGPESGVAPTHVHTWYAPRISSFLNLLTVTSAREKPLCGEEFGILLDVNAYITLCALASWALGLMEYRSGSVDTQ